MMLGVKIPCLFSSLFPALSCSCTELLLYWTNGETAGELSIELAGYDELVRLEVA